jgi:hypothetical protein
VLEGSNLIFQDSRYIIMKKSLKTDLRMDKFKTTLPNRESAQKRFLRETT